MKRTPSRLLVALKYTCVLKKNIILLIKKIGLEGFFKWISKHQKITAWSTGVVALYNLHLIKNENELLKFDKRQFEIVKMRLDSRNTTINSLDWPWYEKLMKNDSFYITGVSDSYEVYYKVNKMDLLGKSNIAVNPNEIGLGWRYTDSSSVTNWSSYDNVEFTLLPDSTIIPVYSHKWPYKEGVDTLVYGISVPISELIATINRNGNVNIIKIIIDNNNKE